MKKIISLLLVFVMVVTLVGCSGSKGTAANSTLTSSANPAPAKKDDMEIAVVLMALNQDYWHLIEAGANSAAQELGIKVKVVGPPVETDVAAQISLIEDCINSGCAGMVLAPTNPSTVGPALKIAKDDGIPIVCVDSDLDASIADDLRLTFIGSSETEGGQLVGEYLVKNYSPDTVVGVIRGPLGAVSHNERVKGCQDIAESKGFKFADIQDGQCDRALAMNVCENMLEGHPEIKVLYCTNDEMAAGAYQACVDKGREDIDIIGYDGSPDCLGLIKDGKVTGTLAQSPFDMGYEAVKILYDTVKNGKFAGESTTLIKTQVIDKSNAVEYLDSLRTKITNAIGKCWF